MFFCIDAADILAGPEKPCDYAAAVRRNVAGSGGSLDEAACALLFRRGLRRHGAGYVFSRDRRLRAAPLLFAPLEDQLLLARRVTCRVLIIKFSQGPYFESRKAYDEQVRSSFSSFIVGRRSFR